MKRVFHVAYAVLMISFLSCTSKKSESPPDNELFSEVAKTDYMYYLGDDDTILPAGGNSPHGFVKIRFNSIAQAALDSVGKLPAGATFPTGATIVKEDFSGPTGNIYGYSIMKKDPSSEYAGSGWIWGEYEADGTPTFSAVKRGSGCISCHSNSPNRDLVRTFDLH